VSRIANSASVAGFSTDQVTNFEVIIRLLKESYQDLIPDETPDASPFRPGMSANVDIRTSVVFDAVSVPIEAVTTRTDTMGTRIDTYRKAAENQDASKTKSLSNQQTQNADLRQYVFVYKNGIVIIREVKTGIQDTEFMHITEGIEVDEEVVIAPYSAVSRDLKSRDKVKKVPREELFKD
jgi:HlyD family secretion protein